MVAGLSISSTFPLEIRKSRRETAGTRMKENMAALTRTRGKRQSQGPSQPTNGQKRPTEDTDHRSGPSTALGRLTQEGQRRGLPASQAFVPETEQQGGLEVLNDYH